MIRLKRRDRLAWRLRQRGHSTRAIATRLAQFEGRATPVSHQRVTQIIQRVERVMRRRARNPQWHDGLSRRTATHLARAGYNTIDAIRGGLSDGVIRPGFTPQFGPRSYDEVVEVFGTSRQASGRATCDQAETRE